MRVSAGIQARSPRLILTLFEPDGALMGHCNSKQRRDYRLIKGMPLGKKATVGFRVMIAIGLRARAVLAEHASGVGVRSPRPYLD